MAGQGMWGVGMVVGVWWRGGDGGGSEVVGYHSQWGCGGNGDGDRGVIGVGMVTGVWWQWECGAPPVPHPLHPCPTPITPLPRTPGTTLPPLSPPCHHTPTTLPDGGRGVVAEGQVCGGR